MQILDYETKVFKLDETHCKQQRKLIFHFLLQLIKFQIQWRNKSNDFSSAKFCFITKDALPFGLDSEIDCSKQFSKWTRKYSRWIYYRTRSIAFVIGSYRRSPVAEGRGKKYSSSRNRSTAERNSVFSSPKAPPPPLPNVFLCFRINRCVEKCSIATPVTNRTKADA